jgi:hypothetical protein
MFMACCPGMRGLSWCGGARWCTARHMASRMLAWMMLLLCSGGCAAQTATLAMSFEDLRAAAATRTNGIIILQQHIEATLPILVGGARTAIVVRR